MEGDTRVIRQQTPQEEEDFEDIAHKKWTPDRLVRDRIAKEEAEANNPKIPYEKKIPYPGSAVLMDYNKAVKMAELERVGYVGGKSLGPKDIQKIKVQAYKNIDWEKYKKATNFEILEEGERIDDNLTKKNPGLTIVIRKKVMKYKGYPHKYVVMEDTASAIKRAKA